MTLTNVEICYLNANGANFGDSFVNELITDVGNIPVGTKINMKALYINSQTPFGSSVVNSVKGPIFSLILDANTQTYVTNPAYTALSNSRLYRDRAGVGISADDIITENLDSDNYGNIVAKLPIIRLNGGENNRYFSSRDGTGQIGLLEVGNSSEFLITITSINVNDTLNGIITNFPYLS